MITGDRMASTRQILDIFQQLLTDCGHPGIREVEPYGPGIGGVEGIRVRFEWDAGSLWVNLQGSDLNSDGKPIDRKPTPKPFLESVPWAPVSDAKAETGFKDKWLIADYALKLVHDLCETTRPDGLTSWTPVGLHNVGLGHGPNGLAVATADGTRLVVRVTIGSGQFRDPDNNPWPDWTLQG